MFLGLGFFGFFVGGLCGAIRIFVPFWRKGNERFIHSLPSLMFKRTAPNLPYVWEQRSTDRSYSVEQNRSSW